MERVNSSSRNNNNRTKQGYPIHVYCMIGLLPMHFAISEYSTRINHTKV